MNQNQELQQQVKDFVKSLVNLEMQKAVIQEDIKALKDDYKEEGVPVSTVTRVLNDIKKNLKKKDSEKFEEEIIKEWLEKDTASIDAISSLLK